MVETWNMDYTIVPPPFFRIMDSSVEGIAVVKVGCPDTLAV
jgi:hypothetical protein